MIERKKQRGKECFMYEYVIRFADDNDDDDGKEEGNCERAPTEC